jgi:mediator of RNA polymerase II transcription subunit 18
MYELFMTAFVNDVDFDRARSLLSGYCWGEPNTRFYRVIHYDGPNPPKPLTKTASIRGIPPQPDPFMYGLPGAEPLQPQVGPYIDPDWKALSDILRKQSYIVTGRWELSPKTDFGGDGGGGGGGGGTEPAPSSSAPPATPSSSPSAQTHPLNAKPGALFWAEIPDPASTAGGQSLVMQRNKIEIWEQLNLPAVLADNGFRVKAESVEETHDIYHRDDPTLEFNLVRHYRLPSPSPDANANANAPMSIPMPAPLPARPDALERADPAGKWVLWARVHVLGDDKSPERVKAGRDTLARVRDELRAAGVEFRVLDRRVHDTQLAVLKGPAMQTLGKTQSLSGSR